MTLTGRGGRLVGMILVVTLAGCPASCTPTPTPPPAADILVSFPDADDPQPLLLYSGSRDGSCRHFESYVGAPDVLLTGVAYDPGCPAEIYVFARGKGAFGLVVDPAKPGTELWLTAALASKSLSIPLASPIPLPMHLWLVADGTDVTTATDLRDRLLGKAYPILDALGTGVTLDTISSVLSSGSIEYDCSAAAEIVANPASYDEFRLNVYFVKNYQYSDWTPAYNCVDVLHPEIIFISWGYDNVQEPTLAHELGHSLGLIHPLADWGHTFAFTTQFESGNFMWDGPEITNVSIGQLYAMNFSRDSWLNTDKSAFKRPEARSCQDNWSSGDCPALDRFVPGGWPPP